MLLTGSVLCLVVFTEREMIQTPPPPLKTNKRVLMHVQDTETDPPLTSSQLWESSERGGATAGLRSLRGGHPHPERRCGEVREEGESGEGGGSIP